MYSAYASIWLVKKYTGMLNIIGLTYINASKTEVCLLVLLYHAVLHKMHEHLFELF